MEIVILDDLTTPVLSGLSAVKTGTSTATIRVTPSKDNGTLYWYVSTSATPPSSSNLQSGSGATAYGNESISALSEIEAAVTGLSGSTTYYAHVMQVDVSLNESDIETSSSFTTDTAGDTTPPVLTADSLTALSASSLRIGVTTDEDNGTWYWVVTTSATQPSKAQIKAGNDHTGSSAPASGSKAISSTGAKTATASGLTAATVYYAHSMHEDAAENQSNRLTSTAQATWPAKPSAITLSAGTSSWTVVSACDYYGVSFDLRAAGAGGGGAGVGAGTLGGSPADCTITADGTTYRAGSGKGGQGRDLGGAGGAGGTASNGATNTDGSSGENHGTFPDNYGGAGGGTYGGARLSSAPPYTGNDATDIRGGGGGGLRNMSEAGGGGGGEGARCISPVISPGTLTVGASLSCSIPAGGVGADGYAGAASKGGDGAAAEIVIDFHDP